MAANGIPAPLKRTFTLKPNIAQKNTQSLKSSVRALLVQKFTSGEKSVLEKLGFVCRSVEDLKVDNFDDDLLLVLRRELQNPGTVPIRDLRSSLAKAQFSDTINKRVGGGDAVEPSLKRKRVDDILDSERKRRREEDELRSIQLRVREKQEKEAREFNEACLENLREAARADLTRMRIHELNWPEDNFRVMQEFDWLLRGYAL